jgi:hypothetical protein
VAAGAEAGRPSATAIAAAATAPIKIVLFGLFICISFRCAARVGLFARARVGSSMRSNGRNGLR